MGQNAEGQGNGTQTLTLSGNLPGGVANQTYNAVLAVSGGASPYQFAVKSGSLPPGVNLNRSTGSLTGTPTAPGSYFFEIGATDIPRPDLGSRSFTISVARPGGVQVNVSPANANLLSNQTQQFTATVSGTPNTAVTWSASVGSIDANGFYTAPPVDSQTNVNVTATSKADPTEAASAAVTVNNANGQPLEITNGDPPDGQMGNAYRTDFSAAGGTRPYTWSITAGNPPPGITLEPSGQFYGTPGATGSFSFTVTVRDSNSKTSQSNFAMNVEAPNGNFDGPAELPRITMQSSMADTPAPGGKVTVPAGGNLQTALNNAHCGDTIDLQAAATFAGTFRFPAKNCDDGHWIIVRTSAPDSALPPERQRVNPCFAGVASLPGRPQYTCGHAQNVMAKLEIQTPSNGPVVFSNGANHYRLIGLEITRPTGGKLISTLVSVDQGGIADHIVIDRSWLHGTVRDETRDGFSLNGTTYVAVVDSYFSDFHCNSNGACTDAHAISGGIGSHQDGVYKIEDNFLEASTEAVMFGGGGATKTPTDIEVRRNHFFKPWQWMPGSPNFVGGVSGQPFVVKNHFELKNAVRVLVEANLMENNWGGFSQAGYAILLTPKNQYTKNGNVCPICQVTDVTIRYTYITHAGAGIQLATAMSHGGHGGGAPAQAGTRWSIHDVVMDDINRNYTGGGALFEAENGWPKNPLNTITINHITGFPDPGSHLFSMGDLAANPQMYGLVFTNNIVTTAAYPVWNTGGGPTSCAYSDVPVTSVSTCFKTYTFANNAIVASPPKYPPSSWPSGNWFAVDPDAVEFVRYNGGNGGNYALQPNSPYKNAGTDHRDLGADFSGLQAALAGVQ